MQVCLIYAIKINLLIIGTLAFKALLLNGQKRVTEANDLIKLTIMKNMKNFTVWHVYGILKKN